MRKIGRKFKVTAGIMVLPRLAQVPVEARAATGMALSGSFIPFGMPTFLLSVKGGNLSDFEKAMLGVAVRGFCGQLSMQSNSNGRELYAQSILVTTR